MTTNLIAPQEEDKYAFLLDSLNKQQREAVTASDDPLLIFAGAGSGKTAVLTRRIAYLLMSERAEINDICAVTFTKKAAGEMAERVEKLIGMSPTPSMWIGTFHALGAFVMRQGNDAEIVKRNRHFSIYDEDDQRRALLRSVDRLGINLKEVGIKPGDVMDAISHFKDELMAPGRVIREAEDADSERIGKIYQAYQTELVASNAMDFDDLIYLPAYLFLHHPEVLKKYHERWKYFLVDEYQDTSQAQFIFISQLAKANQRLTVVGDDDQAIFGWRGADVRNIRSFHETYPNAKVVKLEQNYRSHQKILEAAHAVISNNQNREDKKLWSQRVEGPTPQVIELTDEEHEGQFVANQMAQLFQTGAYKYTQMAILYRRNSQSRALEQELMRKGIPYHIARGTKFFERAEIRDLMAYMMVLQNPQNTSAFLRCIGSPKRGVGESSAEKVIAEARRTGLSILEAAKSPVVLGSVSTAARKGLGAFNRMMETGQTMFSEQGPSAILSFLLEESGLKASIESQGGAEGRDRLDNLQELVSLARDMDTLPPPDGVVKFLDDVQLLSDSDGVGEKKPGVTLLTVHSSKGLEYSVVFVTGLEEGTFPDYKNLEGEKLEEERRLAYVALTRAKDHLFLTYCRTRNFFGREQILEPSEFLAEIPNELVNKRRLAKTVGRKAQIFPHRGGTGNSFSFPKKSGPGGQGFPGRGF